LQHLRPQFEIWSKQLVGVEEIVGHDAQPHQPYEVQGALHFGLFGCHVMQVRDMEHSLVSAPHTFRHQIPVNKARARNRWIFFSFHARYDSVFGLGVAESERANRLCCDIHPFAFQRPGF
jgi:hypothetical protein